MDEVPQHPVMQRWWAHMKDIMAANPDGSPVTAPAGRDVPSGVRIWVDWSRCSTSARPTSRSSPLTATAKSSANDDSAPRQSLPRGRVPITASTPKALGASSRRRSRRSRGDIRSRRYRYRPMAPRGRWSTTRAWRCRRSTMIRRLRRRRRGLRGAAPAVFRDVVAQPPARLQSRPADFYSFRHYPTEVADGDGVPGLAAILGLAPMRRDGVGSDFARRPYGPLDPHARRLSSLVERQGWLSLFPPFRKAWERLGPLRPEVAAATGLDRNVGVLCGRTIPMLRSFRSLCRRQATSR